MFSYKSLYSLGLGPGDVVGDVHRFRHVARDGFNKTDTPDQRFFKLLFYFINDREDDPTVVDFFNGGSSGLLDPTWLRSNGEDFYKYNTAWAYLRNNYEEERANALRQFIILLSQISSESPWYFKEVSGVDEALVREKWMVNEERKKISIKCMPDPVDHRMETLLSLYRSIVWSHTRKCEVLPANLRKFDMGLFIFSSPVDGMAYTRTPAHNGFGDDILNDIIKRGGEPYDYDWKSIGDVDNPFKRNPDGTVTSTPTNAAYKYVEFHNCEISMDSLKSGFGQMTNEQGFEQEFVIDIYFDDCYENEYNPAIMNFYGDFFVWDLWNNIGRSANGSVTGDLPQIEKFEYGIPSETENESSDKSIWDLLKESQSDRIDAIKKQAIGSVQGAIDDVKTAAKNMVTGGLGNIYGTGGGVNGALDAVQQELSKQMKSIQNKVVGNITDSATKISKSLTNAVTAPVLGTIKATGTMMGDLTDAASNVVLKPVLGTTKMIETASVHAADAGLSYVDEAGQYVANESKKIGNIAYDKQVGVTNQIGKNRLNAKLGKI